ncbi:MAG: hypothetical protein QNK31_13465 [Porticoccus sp.]|nr:hypothetical protein [Porticoccus sp.]
MVTYNVEIFQECAHGFDVLVRLIDGRTLCIEKSGKRSNEKYSIDLLALDDTSQSEMLLGWKWFVAGIASILLVVAFITFLPMLDESMLYESAVIIVGLCVSGGSLYMAWNSTSRWQVFYSRNASVPLVELAMNKPTKKDFSSFVRKVEGCIESAQQSLVLSLNNQLAGEMRMLRRLREEGVVSTKVYTKAKMTLLEKH